MRRTVIVTLVALFALTLAGLGGVAFAAASPNAVAPPTKTVAIKAGCGFGCFRPAALTVPRGTKVVWKNTSGIAHTVTRCTVAACGVNRGTGTQSGPRSKAIGSGRTYSFTFSKPGTYRYYCMFHGYAAMHGTITVR